MTPRTRFTTHEAAMTRTWSVFDHLRGYSIRHGLIYAAALSSARGEEAAWRARCQRWIEAEWRGALL